MASGIYAIGIHGALTGAIDYDTDTFKVLLTTSTYTENFNTHSYRNSVTNEVANGNGYTTGGNTATVTVTNDTGNNRHDVSLGGTSWTTSTITARKAVYYKSRGGASSADELVALNDFGSDVISSSGTFTLNASTLRISR